MRRILKILMVLVGLILFNQCTVNYSFTGASIDPNIKTINIKYFQNNASLVQPTLSQTLTDAMRDKFTNETSLILVNSGGDLILEGAITGYGTKPVSIQSGDEAALTRLTITIEVTYTNTFDENMSFETSFSRYSDFDKSQQLTAIEDQLIEEINTQLVEDVFNKAVINW